MLSKIAKWLVASDQFTQPMFNPCMRGVRGRKARASHARRVNRAKRLKFAEAYLRMYRQNAKLSTAERVARAIVP